MVVAATLVAFVAVVAVVAEPAVVALVAVVALPDKAPEKVVVERVFVLGLKVRPVPKLNGWFPFEELAKKEG